MSNFKEKLPLFQSNDVQISNVVNAVWSIANTLRGVTVQISIEMLSFQCLS